MKVRFQCAELIRLVLSLCLIIAVTGLNTACQKKPVTENASAAALENSEAPSVSSKSQLIELPEHVSAQPTAIANMTLAIDADVTSPENASFLLQKVTPHEFVFSELQRIGEAAAEKPALELYSRYEPGKAYWDRKLSDVLESSEADADYIEYLEHKRREAPEQDEKLKFGDSNPSRPSGQTDVYFDNDSEIGRLTFFPGGNQVGFNRDITESFLPESLMDADSGEDIHEEPAVSKEEARKEAEAFRDRFAPDLTEVTVEPCIIRNSSGRGSATGWYFAFTRSVGGLQKTFSKNAYYIDPESAPTQAAPWEQEVLTLTVDDRGIVALMWTGASELDGAESENVALLPFSDIQQQAVAQLGYMYGPMENGEGQGVKLTITDFSLGTEMLAAADNPEMGVYAPVWAVSFNRTYGGTEVSHEQIFLDAQNGRYVEPRVTTTYLMEYE